MLVHTSRVSYCLRMLKQFRIKSRSTLACTLSNIVPLACSHLSPKILIIKSYCNRKSYATTASSVITWVYLAPWIRACLYRIFLHLSEILLFEFSVRFNLHPASWIQMKYQLVNMINMMGFCYIFQPTILCINKMIARTKNSSVLLLFFHVLLIYKVYHSILYYNRVP